MKYKATKTILSIIALITYTSLCTANQHFPFGVFDKSDPYQKFDKKDYHVGSAKWMTYRQEFVKKLKKYNINTVINTPYKNDNHTRFVLDTFYNNNIKVIFQPGNPFNKKSSISSPGYTVDSVYQHPSIIAYKLWDEPKTLEKLNKLKRWYGLIEKHYDKPIVTAMIGELMGESSTGKALNVKGDDKDIAIAAWRTLDSKILFARHYPYRRQYDLVNWYKEKMKMPFHEWCAYMETAYKGRPWWYIPQLFGKGKNKSKKSYWRFPTSNETNALIHTALANGARGIIGWGIPTYDYTKKPSRKMFLDENLTPEVARDGSIPMNQYGEIGRLTKDHADLLLRHKKANIQFKGTNNEVLKITRTDPKTKKLYMYTVNLNTEKTNIASFIIPEPFNITHAVDVYSNKQLNTTINTKGTEIVYKLTPGEAFFVQLD